MKFVDAFIGNAGLWASRSSGLVRLAAKIGYQCSRIVGLSLSAGTDQDSNGERWLIERFRGTARNFVDVGANVGHWAELMAANMAEPRGLAFEPAPGTAARLRTTLAAFPQIEIVEKALSDQPGTADFQVEPDMGETSSLLAVHSKQDASTIRVAVSTIDAELAAHGIDHLSMLKIDAEGYDCRVLMGAQDYLSRGAIDVIQFEYNVPWADAGSTLGSAIAFLDRHGYDVSVLLPGGLRPYRYDDYREFFHYSNFVAVRRGFAFPG